MMFLQYAAPGLVLPIISHYLKNFLGFEPYQTGLIMAMPAAAAIIAPLVTVYVADRCLSSERLLGLCHAAAGLMLLVVSAQTEFLPFLFAYTAYGLVFAPTFALSNAVVFHHVENPGRDFGPIRMWGPLSWVVAAWSFSYLWLGRQPSPERPTVSPTRSISHPPPPSALGSTHCHCPPRRSP